MPQVRLLPGTARGGLRVDTLQRRDGGDTTGNATRITGYGAVFFDPKDAGSEYWLWSDVVERIMPGAFDRALREDDVRCFFNHDPNLILGRTESDTLKLSIDAKGLRYDVTPADTDVAKHVLAAIERGDVDGSSFMFEVGAATWVESQDADGGTIWTRQITEVAPLYEVGPVVFPAYEGTSSEVGDGRQQRAAGDAVPTAWRQWYERHVLRARQSLKDFQLNRGLAGVLDARARRARSRRAFELRQL